MKWKTKYAEPSFGSVLPGSVSLHTHSPQACRGQWCVVHNPSSHHMRDWPTLYRADRHLTERICPHGVGHPDPDDLSWHASQGRDYQGVHGCDGCCMEVKP